MKKKMVIAASAALIMFVLSVVAAYAGDTRDPGIRGRIEEQQKRIDQGIASGSLTRQEADIVQDNLNRIRESEARMKADGRLTPRERARLEHMLDRNSKMIYKEKHNPIRRIE
jgi:polyhydroxyalkanoate synthesis regulator phasin